MNMFNKLLAVEDRPKKLHGHGGGTYKAPKVNPKIKNFWKKMLG
jgi:hypothetical protein